MKKHLSLILIAVLLLSAFVGLYSVSNLPLVHASGGITLVQGPFRQVSYTGAAMTISMTSNPTTSDTIILTIGVEYGTVSSVAESGVSWSYQTGYNYASQFLDVEVWVGTVSQSLSNQILITLSVGNWGGISDAIEYSGIMLTNFLDKTGNAVSGW